MDAPRWRIAPVPHDDGTRSWVAELLDDRGHVVDSSELTSSPVTAHRYGEALAQGIYWREADQPHRHPRYTTAA